MTDQTGIIITTESATAAGIKTTTQNHHHNNVNEDDETEAMIKATVIMGSIALPMTMQAAVELGLLEIIANKEKEKGPVTASEVVAELMTTDNSLAADMVERMLRLLAAFSVVSCSVEIGKGQVFGLTAVGKYFVKDENSMSLGPLLKLHQDKVFMEAWYKQKDAVLEGEIPFNKAHGISSSEYTKTDPRFSHVFNTAMFNYTTIVMKKALQTYKGFENINLLVDVGGGLGHNLKTIISKYPTIKGINFDLPHVTEQGIVHPGLEHVSGDMFERVPYGDAIFMKAILHAKDDDHCVKLLKNCYNALPTNGKVIVMESIMAEENETNLDAQAMCEKDLIMMTVSQQGRERTYKEFLHLAEASGFAGVVRGLCLWVVDHGVLQVNNI